MALVFKHLTSTSAWNHSAKNYGMMDALNFIFCYSSHLLQSLSGVCQTRNKCKQTLLQPKADSRSINSLPDFIEQPDTLSLPTPPVSHYRRWRHNAAMHSFLQKSIPITINTFSNIIMFKPLLLSYITIILQTYESKWSWNALLTLLRITKSIL